MKKVFMIIPFEEPFLALFNLIKETYKDTFTLVHAADLNNQKTQQAILKDIVEGIYNADLIIADLTNSNPNVMYELGIAHTLNKSVIHITQDITTLPFDLKAYRTIEYSTQFYRIDSFMNELNGIMVAFQSDSVKFGNPVTDYLPATKEPIVQIAQAQNVPIKTEEGFMNLEEEIMGSADKMADLLEKLTTHLTTTSEELAIHTQNLNANKGNSSYARMIINNISNTLFKLSDKLKPFNSDYITTWNKYELSVLGLLDNKLIANQTNLEKLNELDTSNTTLQLSIQEAKSNIELLSIELSKARGVENTLTKAIDIVDEQLNIFIRSMERSISGIDRMHERSIVILDKIKAIK